MTRFYFKKNGDVSVYDNSEYYVQYYAKHKERIKRAQRERINDPINRVYCTHCKKTYFKHVYASHLKTQKHQKRITMNMFMARVSSPSNTLQITANAIPDGMLLYDPSAEPVASDAQVPAVASV